MTRRAMSCAAAFATTLAGLLSGVTAHALTAAEASNAATRNHERLTQMRVLRGAAIAHKFVDVTAATGEAWTASVEGAFVSVTPSTERTGSERVRVSFTSAALTGDGPFDGAVVITPAAGGAPVRIAINVQVWPKDVDDLTVEQLKDRSNWPAGDGYDGAWELWGFLPDQTSHPGTIAGQNMRVEEKTQCSGGSTTNCTRAGQAGLTSGQSADRAWLLSRGDPSVAVAVLDSGIKWRERSLYEKAYLNARELSTCAPPGATANQPATFDVNGDGIFNIRDYDWADPTYADVNNTGFLDPQDLIHGTNPATNAPCSDGVDDDDNGYMDDISGWDFMWNDNDPSDDTEYGHGTGEANDSVGQALDDTGAIGICPRCTLLNVRVGDSFVADVNQFAEGVLFAVDSGASVVQEALGTINHTGFMTAAIDYAWNNGVLVVGSAADETSVHHNYPANAEHLINVHAITYDTDGERDSWRAATTFLNFNNCTNYGGHLQLSTPGSSCSSEATGKTSGQAGLLYSYYVELQRGDDAYYDAPLSAAEAFQVLIASAEDIDVTGAEQDPEALAAKKYISNEGWDEAFGYGRNNARRSLELLRDKLIPPEVDITTPRFFEQFDPARTPTVSVDGSVNVRRDDAADWVLEMAKGIAPAESEFTQVAQGSVTKGAPHSGKFGDVDISALFADAETPKLDRDARTVTIRVRATVTSRGNGAIRGEYRKVFSVLRDPQRRASLALFLGASGEASPRLTDLDGDGKDELVLPTADGIIHAYRGDGTELPGWPVTVADYPSVSAAYCDATDPAIRSRCHIRSNAYTSGAIDPATLHSSIVGAASVGDLDGSGGPERDVVVTTLDGQVFAFSASGAPLDGFPLSMDPAHVEEFLWAKIPSNDHRFAELGFFAAPMLVDLDRDGDLEIVASGMDQWVYAWHHDGNAVNGWPVHLYNRNLELGPGGRFDERILAAPTAADLDGDGRPEVVVGTEELTDNTNNATLYAIKPDGDASEGGPFMPGWPTTLSGFIDEVLPYVGKGMPNAVAAADLNGDGKDEILGAAMGAGMQKIDANGGEYGPGIGEPAAMSQSSEGYGPLHNTSETIIACLINNPTIADLDGNGRLDVINGIAGLGLAGAAESGGQRFPYEHMVGAWDIASGEFLDGFPQVVEDFQFFGNYAVGDIDGDGAHETISGNGVYFVHAFNSDGQEPAGWPKNTMGWVVSTPALGDMDDDNQMEVAVNTRDGWLFVWNMPGRVKKLTADEKPGPIQWHGYRHDDRNTGNVRTPIRDYGTVVTPPPPPDGPCNCESTTTRVPGALVLLLGVVVARRRRRA